MLNFWKRFWTEEDGMTAIEMVVIIAVLLVVALTFREAIVKYINQLINAIFKNPNIEIDSARTEETFGG